MIDVVWLTSKYCSGNCMRDKGIQRNDGLLKEDCNWPKSCDWQVTYSSIWDWVPLKQINIYDERELVDIVWSPNLYSSNEIIEINRSYHMILSFDDIFVLVVLGKKANVSNVFNRF